MVKRRKVLFGIGAIAAGGAAATATGAFSSAQMNRDAEIDVVDDSDGLVALEAGNDSAVWETDSGEMKIDIDPDDNDAGVNVNSRYQIGYPKGHDVDVVSDAPDGSAHPEADLSDAAFQITNQDSVEHKIKTKYEAESPGGSAIWFELTPNYATKDEQIKVTEGSNPDSATYTVPSGDTLGVAILIDTTDGSTSDDLGGTLTVSAD